MHLRHCGDNDELYFRDYLIEHPDIAREYEKLKLNLWKEYEHNRDGYTNAKTEFIKNIQNKRKVYIRTDIKNLNLGGSGKMQYNSEFWNALDKLVTNSEIVIDRPKGTSHPKYPNFIYRVDYGYLKDTSSMDGAGIDVWVGSGEKKVDAIMCIVDLMKKDSEIKILIGCTEEEKAIVYETHNETQFMKGVLILR